MSIEGLNERGLRDSLTAVADARRNLRARLQESEQQLAMRESEANGLRKLDSFLDMLEEYFRARVRVIEEKRK